MLDTRPKHWSSLAKTLHWLTVFLILLEIPAGFLMSYTYPLSMRDKDGLTVHQLAGQIHHTNGFLILALVIGRLGWRCVHTAPRAVQAFHYERLLATISHFGLYALLIVLPLSGWAALSVFGAAPIWFFDHDHLVPAILAKRPVDSPHGYGFFAGIHVWSYEIGAVILIVHIGAAFWHYFVRRDGVFQGMWPLARKDG